MIYREVKGDIFALSKSEYVFAHCIATDLHWGAGMATKMMKEFKAAARWRKDTCTAEYRIGDIGVDESDKGIMVNLFTKADTHAKPTYQSMEQCLKNLRAYMLSHHHTQLAIPRIGSGLDKLSWPMVKDLIEKVFKDTDITIEVRYL